MPRELKITARKLNSGATTRYSECGEEEAKYKPGDQEEIIELEKEVFLKKTQEKEEDYLPLLWEEEECDGKKTVRWCDDNLVSIKYFNACLLYTSPSPRDS